MNRIMYKLPFKSPAWKQTRFYSTKNMNKFSTYLDIKPEIVDVLHTNTKPLVALESTIITHGMPFPDNLDTAIQVEEIVRRQNAIPVTIAILDGKIKIGLSSDDLEKLAKKAGNKPTVKTSRRDLAYVLRNKFNGGTTVAATLMICNMVGIKIFATGGIGGVHRNFESTLDVSADLLELGKSSTAVICSGIKSILDIPRTLEVLETQGVFVSAFQSQDKEFPAFYTRKSGVKAPYVIDSVTEAAHILKINDDLELNSGILISVPIPEKYAMDETLINNAIEEALENAKSNGITGKEITPFILEAVSKITKGQSLEANIALIKNNAEIAAKIAVEYNKLINHETIIIDENKYIEKDHTAFLPEMAPVIFGGSNIDTCITILDDDVKLQKSINKVVENVMSLCVEDTVHKSNLTKKVSTLISSYRKIAANRFRESDTQKEKASSFLTDIYAKSFTIPIKTAPKHKLSLNSDIIDIDQDNISIDDDDKDWEPPVKKCRTEADPKKVITEFLKTAQNSKYVTDALDRTKITDRGFTHVIAAMAKSAELPVKKVLRAPTTIRNRRIKNRRVLYDENNDSFRDFIQTQSPTLTCHWDGKLLPNSTNTGKEEITVDRVPVVVTGENVEKTLGVPKLSNGTGAAQMEAIWALLVKYLLLPFVKAICFDTTSTNTGIVIGACILLAEKFFPQKFLFLACRKHVYELFIGVVFTVLLGKSDSPQLGQKFSDLKKNWLHIDTRKYDVINFKAKKYMNKNILKLKKEAVCFLKSVAPNKQVRDDYKEIIELCLILLGERKFLGQNFSFKAPQGISRARWMAKIIYGAKLFLFRNQFSLTTDEAQNLELFCVFTCLVYIKPWLQTCFPCEAAVNDLSFIQNTRLFKNIAPKMTSEVEKKFQRHSWYLSGETIGFCLFSKNVTHQMKRKIVEKIKSITPNWETRHYKCPQSTSFQKKHLYDFVNETTLPALQLLEIEINELIKHDPSEWEEMNAYLNGKKVIENLGVINDVAERKIKLATDYNSFATKNEQVKQEILQNVEKNRQNIKKASKKDFAAYYDNN